MTSFEVIPIAPPMLGDVLANPVAYAEAAVAGQTLPTAFPVPASRVRRPGRVRRRVAMLAAVVAAVGLSAVGRAGGIR